MNKTVIKALSICLSAAMLTGSFAPAAVTNVISPANVITAATADEPVELIKNNDCDTTKKYGVYLAGGGADGVLTAEDGQLALKISNRGKVNYGVQLFYDILPLYQNGKYRLSFDISCDADRYIEAMIQQNGGTYQSYVWAGLDLTSEVQHVSKEFTMKYETDTVSKLCFNCGLEKDDPEDLGEHTIYLDNIHLELIDDSEVDYSGYEVIEQKILTNQVGYLPEAAKNAVFRGDTVGKTFDVVNADTEKVVFTGDLSEAVDNLKADEKDAFGDFSSVKEPGKYYIVSGEEKSPVFTIGEDAYNDLLEKSVYMFYLQRCGVEVEDDLAAHPSCHDTDAVLYHTTDKAEVNGGWHDAGDYGRYVVAGAKAVADLLIAYQTNPSLFSDNTGIPESGNGVADILDEARYEIEWMLKMQDKESGGVHHKVTCENFAGYVMPEKETDQLIVTEISTTATADFCATMAMAYEWYKDIDKDFADKCLAAAESAWGFLEAHPEFIFKNPKDIVTGDYGDKSDADERYWATAQMYRATGDKKYGELFSVSNTKSGMGWADMGDYASFAYLTMDNSMQDPDVVAKVEASVLKQAKKMVAQAEENPYGETLGGYFWGCNMNAADDGMILYLADKIDPSAGYKKVAAEQLHYLLGKNPLGTCFVTGFGTISPENPHHRPSMAIGKAVPGMLVGGPNSGLEDSMAEGLLEDVAPAKCWLDNSESYSTNEITIYWNSPLVALIADVLSEDKNGEDIQPPVTEPTDTTTPGTDEIIYGDVNKDGVVDLTDVTGISLVLLKDDEFDADQAKAADVDGDNKVTLADLTRLLQYVKKEVSTLGPEK